MRNPIKSMVLCLFTFLCLSPVQAADLQAYKEVYQKNAEEIRQSFQPKFDGLQQQYRKSLETLKSRAQSRGDLKTTKAALAESERFQKARFLPANQDEKEIPEIKAFQTAYVNQYNRLETEMTASLGALTVKYEQALDRLLKELTKAGKLDEATVVEAEQTQAQTALKGYADQMAALTGSPASNAPPVVAAWPTPVTAAAKADAEKDLYLVIDLSQGTQAKEYPVNTLADVPKGGWSDEYKTDKLVLRKIEPGTFVMGSPEDEVGHNGEETQHTVTLTQAFYIGVFTVTQKQWERVMGDWPSHFNKASCRDSRPVEKVSYNDICGAVAGAGWPATNSVDAASFLGRLRARTGKAFSLPTESQWEYACRAGTATALNSGKNLTSKEADPNLSELGRYKGNSEEGAQNADTRVGTAKVGSYLPNAWGLYDMHGNVWEWCLDWRASYPGAGSDPKGALTGSTRVGRGGTWYYGAFGCRSAFRNGAPPESRHCGVGFRISLPPDQQ